MSRVRISHLNASSLRPNIPPSIAPHGIPRTQIGYSQVSSWISPFLPTHNQSLDPINSIADYLPNQCTSPDCYCCYLDSDRPLFSLDCWNNLLLIFFRLLFLLLSSDLLTIFFTKWKFDRMTALLKACAFRIKSKLPCIAPRKAHHHHFMLTFPNLLWTLGQPSWP